jgi:basic amino acid/polyamine antiporter, APA family
MNSHKIGFYTAISIVIANMIGTGVFTSLGFQVTGIQSGGALLALWIVGGVLALCGALTYGEIGAAYPENGGEFYYLSKLYHPAVGFLSGWVSVTVGFAAPIAAASMALGKYVSSIYPTVNVMILAIVVIIGITFLHSFNLRTGSAFQRVFTIVKVTVIILFVVFGISHTPDFTISFKIDDSAMSQIFSASFASSLIYVTYAYSGWNAAAYLSGEIKDVNRTLPRALFYGTLIVLVVYTLLNFVFLYTTPIETLKGQVEIGYLSANRIFGEGIGKYMSLAIAVLLISTISAMVLAGPRVMQSMGKAIPSLRGLAKSNKNGVPYIAIALQSLIAIVLVILASFESLINYIGFTLNLFTFLTVFGIFILRFKKRDVERPFKTPLFPLPPILFLIILGWILVNVLMEKPMESLLGLLTVLGGLIFYYITVYLDRQKNETL